MSTTKQLEYILTYFPEDEVILKCETDEQIFVIYHQVKKHNLNK